MEILNVKVKKETKNKIERSAKARSYKNNSEAVRKVLEDHLEEHPEIFAPEDVADLVREAEEISDREFDRLAAEVFKGSRTAAELVAEGRERRCRAGPSRSILTTFDSRAA
jgi:Arc/MetJ-type ribon-helix-helix transcriptional regulator